MRVVPVELGDRAYEVRIAPGLLEQAGKQLQPFIRGGRLVVVSDEQVWAAQGARLTEALDGVDVNPVLVAAGEGSKSFTVLADLMDRLLALEIERSEHIVAFGGGVIGDLTGFASAILKRGCGFVQVPTTLLSHVDSSVGGKTGINVAAGKNLVGAFHQPSLVLIDPEVLDTLDARQVRAGYAEIAKYGLIEDADFFVWLEANGHAVIEGDLEARCYAIEKAVAGKARIVAADERETGDKRALLNLGHTFGHALEAETGYSERLLHGEAVALGCVQAMTFSAERRLCSADDAERTRAHFAAVGLPTSLAEAGITASGEVLTRHMASDKKKAGGKVAFILSRGIGQAYVDRTVDMADVAAFLDRNG
ncbi:3-dehydroquinate synthase [Sphingomonas piscis]|uniref:3-dehydroquinate synthase n=1 Tax=Sphingomonas piscis TaxID=2714943 RepID=A0A6G7YNJ1_9SPHN|nr:3-dehydroquinate synthase [Sphingomonas piscis]QIK78304.1 3-dehydroquinate synthase [Sphingomonas piscis]